LIESEKIADLNQIPDDIFKDSIEKLFLFSTIWTYGGSLDESKKIEFSEMLKNTFKKQMALVPGQ